MTAAFVLGLMALAGLVTTLALRDHRRTIAARQSLLDACRGQLDSERWSVGGDGFPALDGRDGGRRVSVRLICDTMVMRRLPQLWLAVTVWSPCPGAASLSILTRHSGNEFYSVTSDLPVRIEPPPGFPADILVRGDGRSAQALCDRLAPDLAALLADPRVKEITLTPHGVRVLRQAAEGRRGEHLLLRQAVFSDAHIAPALLQQMLSEGARLAAMRSPGDRTVRSPGEDVRAA